MKVCHLHFMVTEGTSVDSPRWGVSVDLRAHFKSGLPTDHNEMPNDRLQFCSIGRGGLTSDRCPRKQLLQYQLSAPRTTFYPPIWFYVILSFILDSSRSLWTGRQRGWEKM